MFAGGHLGITHGLAGARNPAIICLANNGSTGKPKSMVEKIGEAQVGAPKSRSTNCCNNPREEHPTMSSHQHSLWDECPPWDLCAMDECSSP